MKIVVTSEFACRFRGDCGRLSWRRVGITGCRRNRAGAGCPEPAATGSCEHPFDGNSARTGDGDYLRTGCRPHSAGSGARGRQRARRANSWQCSTTLRCARRSTRHKQESRLLNSSRLPRRPMRSWPPAPWIDTGNFRPRRASARRRWTKLHSGLLQPPPGSRQCARKPTRHVPRKPARTPCLAIPVWWRHLRAS